MRRPHYFILSGFLSKAVKFQDNNYNNQEDNNGMQNIPTLVDIFSLQKTGKLLAAFNEDKKRQNGDHPPDFKNKGKHVIYF